MSEELIFSNLFNTCRFCLQYIEVDRIPINEEIEAEFRNLTKHQGLLNINNLTNICGYCYSHLKFSSKFKNKILQVEEKLLAKFSEETEALEEGTEYIIQNIKQEIDYELNRIDEENELEKYIKLENEDPEPEFEEEPIVAYEYPILEEENQKMKKKQMKTKPMKLEKLIKHVKKQKTDSVLCSECGGIFRRDSLKIHIERVHLKIKRFFCDICDYRSYLKAHIRHHMASHSKERNYECDICHTFLPTPSALASHKLFRHSTDRPFNCDFKNCKKSFKRKGLLAEHIRVVHRKERNFICDFENCNQTFSKQVLLRNHQMKHYEEPKLSCEVCGRLYHTIYNLQKHLVTHEEPKFSCEICQKKFFKKYNCEIHKKTHFGIKDFSCELCDSKYYKKDHLNRHIINVHHKIKLKCALCPTQFARKDAYKKHVLNQHRNLGKEVLDELLANIKKIKAVVDESTLQVKTLGM